MRDNNQIGLLINVNVLHLKDGLKRMVNMLEPSAPAALKPTTDPKEAGPPVSSERTRRVWCGLLMRRISMAWAATAKQKVPPVQPLPSGHVLPQPLARSTAP